MGTYWLRDMIEDDVVLFPLDRIVFRERLKNLINEDMNRETKRIGVVRTWGNT